ncbi:MAG: deoxyribonuclease V [Pseudomonadota bacterium]
MKVIQIHPWNVTYHEAIEIQERLRHQLKFEKVSRKIRYVAGTDVSFSKKTGMAWGGVVVLNFPDLSKVEEKWVREKVKFPYISGLLSFREVPVLLSAMDRLEVYPDLILCDGQGNAHPRGIGLASHLGLMLDAPTIGCAKNRLVGEFSKVGPEKGNYTFLWYKGQLVGAVIRTRRRVRPIFVSQGNKITLDESVNMVLTCCQKYRIPEPIREAHLLVTRLRKGEGDG